MRRSLIAIASCAALLAGCGSNQDATVDVVAIGPPESAFEPGGRLSPAAQLLRGAIAQGLVTLDERGQVVPGMADRWIVADDGLSYIFRLRDGRWTDGSKLTAESARAALNQAIAGVQGTGMARDLAGIGDIRVMTGRVIELRLARPQPELLLLLAQPELGLQQRGRGAGPMQLKREKAVATLTMREPDALGLPVDPDWQDRIRTLMLQALPAKAALERYNRGEVNAVLGGRIEHFPLVDAAGLSRGAIQLDPVTGLFGLAVVHDDGFLSEPANREAIAMAIDRDGLIAALGLGGWTATSRIVATGVADDAGGIGERWSDMDLAERQSVAAARVTRWRGGKSDAVTLRLAMPPGPGADILFARLSGDLAKAGLVAQRVGPGDAADLRLVDSVARYARVSWFLNQLHCSSQRNLCSVEADDLAAEASATPDPASRTALYARAEAMLTEANVFIPFGPPIRWSLVRGDTTGFVANRLAYHPLMPLALRPK
jgi:ABC-type transport system substrate-binding protein